MFNFFIVKQKQLYFKFDLNSLPKVKVVFFSFFYFRRKCFGVKGRVKVCAISETNELMRFFYFIKYYVLCIVS